MATSYIKRIKLPNNTIYDVCDETARTNLNLKQDITDNALSTAAKTIPAAINELVTKNTSQDTRIEEVSQAIPTKISTLTNDSEYITKSVVELDNFYTKTEVSTALVGKVNSADFTATAIITKLGDNAVNRATSDSEGNVIIDTYATKGEVSNKVNSVDYTAEKIIEKLGTYPVNRSTGDKNGNDIATTYATKTENNAKLNSSDFNATNIVSKLGTTSVNRASSDSLGNNIVDTYATKSALNGKLDSNANAIITALGDNAVNKANKAVADENGNNIASTYQRSAFKVNGSVATNGTITFTGLVISDLLNAITNKQRIVFIPSDTSLASVDLNAIKTSDTSYALKGSFTANVSSNLTNYSCVIIATSSSASGTYTSQTANDYTYTLPTASTSVLGGVKVDGTTIVITNGVIKVAQSGQQTIQLLSSFPTI